MDLNHHLQVFCLHVLQLHHMPIKPEWRDLNPQSPTPNGWCVKLRYTQDGSDAWTRTRTNGHKPRRARITPHPNIANFRLQQVAQDLNPNKEFWRLLCYHYTSDL
jgi:hypothetical protein